MQMVRVSGNTYRGERGEYLKRIMIRRTVVSEWPDEDSATALEVTSKPLLVLPTRTKTKIEVTNKRSATRTAAVVCVESKTMWSSKSLLKRLTLSRIMRRLTNTASRIAKYS